MYPLKITFDVINCIGLLNKTSTTVENPLTALNIQDEKLSLLIILTKAGLLLLWLLLENFGSCAHNYKTETAHM